MDDIVAIRATLDDGSEHFFLTWGRIPEKINEGPLLGAIRDNIHRFSLPARPISISLCDSLQESSSARYFYEGLFSICQKPIPFGKRYGQWATEMWERMKEGSEIYYIGTVPSRNGPAAGSQSQEK